SISIRPTSCSSATNQPSKRSANCSPCWNWSCPAHSLTATSPTSSPRLCEPRTRTDDGSMMAIYGRFHQAMRDGTAGKALPRWTIGLLGEVTQNRRNVTGVRHPLGFLCLPLERTGGAGICVHVWSDSLPQMSLTTSPIHAHSWDLVSYVLYGSLRNEVMDVIDAPEDATYRVLEVRSGKDVDELRETTRLVRAHVRTVELHHRGDTYSLAAGIFHATAVQGEAATVALGRSRRGVMDLSLGGIESKTHRVRRQRCDHDETARAARMVTEALTRIRPANREARSDP